MTFWQSWWRALSHPADNVVAAVIVLFGAVLTVTGTLLVSYLNRKHETTKTIREAVARVRDAAYLDAQRLLIEVQDGEPPEDEVSDAFKAEFNLLLARMMMYGTVDATVAWTDAVRSTLLMVEKRVDSHDGSQDSEDESTSVIRDVNRFRLIVREELFQPAKMTREERRQRGTGRKV